MSIRIIKREPGLEDKEVILEIDSTQDGQPAESTFSVKGQITDNKGAGVADITVRAYDKGNNADVLLGESITTAEGNYLIYYSNSLLPSGKLRADLLIQVYDTSGAQDVLVAESPVIVSALTNETVDISTAQEDYVGPSEYTLIVEKLEPLLTGSDITTMDIEAIAILSAKTDLGFGSVADYLKAKTLVSGVSVSQEVMYGLMRFDLPYNLADLLNVSDKDITEAIEATTKSNIIDPDLVNDTPTIIASFRQGVIDDALVDGDAGDGESEFAKLSNIAGLSVAKQKSFYAAYLDKGDTGTTFWDEIVTDNTLTATERDAVRLTFQLSIVAQGHIPMVSTLKGNPVVTDIGDVASFTKTDWLNFINLAGVGVPNIEEVDITEPDKHTYADALIQTAEDTFPTSVLKKSLEGDSDYTGTDLLQFVQDNPVYDFKDVSPSKYLQDNPTALDNVSDVVLATQEINKTKRLWHLATGSDKRKHIKTLSSANLTSASKVASVGRRSFVRKYSASLGGEAVAKEIYKKAAKRSAAALILQSDYNPTLNSVGTRVFGSSPVTESDATANPELQVFFGSQDYCNCTHCRSSLSAAAYLVDLLAFLQEAENTGGAQTAWQQLQLRRPELQKIALSCKNTNTVIPYIDLVNEVLEYAVSPGTGNMLRQTTWDVEVLRVEPEHINTAAYDTLALAVYPWLLPFNLWNEEGRVYLKKLNINRNDIIRALDGNSDEKAPMSIIEAYTYLGISTKMQEVLTDGTTFTAYYGGVNSTALQPVKALIDKVGLDYDTLLDLLETDFVNPTNKTITFIPANSCNIEDATLDFASAEYIDLHRFVRLSHILNWSFSTLDMVITALGYTNITNALIIHMAGISKIEKKYKLMPVEIMTWYGSVSNKVYNKEPTQYEQLFLNPAFYSDIALQAIYRDADITPVAIVTSGGELNAANAAVLQGLLRISGEELLILVNNELPAGTASKEQLTHLYRVSSFTKALKIRILDYISLKKITGLKPLTEVNPVSNTKPEDSLAFITWFDVINDNGITVDDLNFLFRHVVSPAYPEGEITTLSSRIAGLRQVVQQKISDRGISTTVGRESLLNVFLLFLDEDSAIKSVAVVEDLTESITDAGTFIDTYWAVIVNNLNDAKTNLVGASALATLPERYSYMFGVLYKALSVELSLQQEISQYLAESYNTSIETLDILLVDQLKNPANAVETAMTLFDSFSFAFSTNEVITPAYQNHIDVITKAYKILFVVDKLKIEANVLGFTLEQTIDTSWYDLKSLPTTFTGADISSAMFDSIIELFKAFNLERKYKTEAFSVINLIKEGVAGVPASELHTTLNLGTGWDNNDINYLTSAAGFNFVSADYKNQGWIEKLQNVVSISLELNASADQIAQWNQQDLTAQQAQSIRLSVKSRYQLNEWFKVAADLRDQLRIQQRDALSAYIIANNVDFKNTDDLFSYYLIDTETAPCMLTSRIKLAISTVQLWVQRIRMDLENGVGFTEEDLDEWKWRKNYRVWEAARKVFLYPENWLEPELRDDKSPFFLNLEDELLQDEVNKETAEKAYLHYLTRLDEVAHLEISATYKEEDRNILHVFARTKDSPHIYFYRTLVDEFQWTAWERVDLDIEAEHLVPVVFNRRPMLFWPIMNEKPVEIVADDLKIETSGGVITKDVKNKVPLTKVEIQMAYSEWRNNKWQAKKVSKASVISAKGKDPSQYFFKAAIDSDGLTIDVFYKSISFDHEGSFYLNNCSGELEALAKGKTALPTNVSVTESVRNYMKIEQNTGGSFFEITERFLFPKQQLLLVKEKIEADKKRILNATPGKFRITYPVSGVELLSDKPFFYEDNNSVFFVTVSKKNFQKKVIIELSPEIIREKVKKPVKLPIPVKKVFPPVEKIIPKVILDSIVKKPINITPKKKKSIVEVTREDIVKFEEPVPMPPPKLPSFKKNLPT